MKVVVRIESADGDRRRAEPLECTRGDERFVAPGQTTQERPDREDDESSHEHASATENVRQAPAEQEEAAEDERVGADHPLQILLREAKIRLDRRQSDVHDGDVEHDDKLRDAEKRQSEPLHAEATIPDRSFDSEDLRQFVDDRIHRRS